MANDIFQRILVADDGSPEGDRAFPPEGIGKTRLLQSFRHVAKRELNLAIDPKSLTTSSLKGVVQRALDVFPFLLVLDHLAGPSRIVTGMI
jgi:hypothetical protein